MDDKERLLEILRAQGFLTPEKWVGYAKQRNFTRIESEKVTCCPDCKNLNSRKVGQYVYYSNLIALKACDNCELIYSDTRIDPKIIKNHFENTYKDEIYFLKSRRNIFYQIADLVDRYTSAGDRVIDIGGGKGHLLDVIRNRRPDLILMLNDLSIRSCEWAESNYQLDAICGSMTDLIQRVQGRFDLILLIDSLYYEPNILKFWQSMSSLLKNGGTVIIRLPNKISFIRFSEFIKRFAKKAEDQEMNTRIKFFNPEHLYVFNRCYLINRLKKLGFNYIKFIPSALLIPNKKMDLLYDLYYWLARIIHILTFGKIIITPSLIVVSKKNNFNKRGQ